MFWEIYDAVIPWFIFVGVILILVSVLFDIGEMIFHRAQRTSDAATDWTELKKQTEPTAEEWAAIVEKHRRG